MNRRAGWIGVDLDGTLAMFERMPVWDGSVGAPVPAMVARVKQWIAEGRDVRILTARVAPYEFSDGGDDDARSVDRQMALVTAWCVEHIGQALPVTCSKDYGMTELWDDRAVQVVTNTGERVADPRLADRSRFDY